MATGTHRPAGADATGPAARQQPAPARRKMQPPLTPMIDVTFQLLLFFVLACEFRPAEGTIPGSLPDRGPYGPAADPVLIRVRPSAGQAAALFEVEGEQVLMHSAEDLYRALAGRKAALGTADVPVIIEPSGDVAWEFVIEAYNQAVRAELRKILFAREI